MIEFDCPYCGKHLRTKDDKAGVESECPDCGERIVVPDPADDGFYDGYDDGPESREAGFDASSPHRERPSTDHSEAWIDEQPDRAQRGGDWMIPCPMCGEEIARNAEVCRYCGESVPGTRSTIPGSGRLDVGEAFSVGWAIFQKQLGMYLGAVIIPIGVYMAVGIVMALLHTVAMFAVLGFQGGRGGPGAPGAEFFVVLIVGMILRILIPLLVLAYLMPGMVRVLLDVTRGRRGNLGDIFQGRSYFLRSVGASFLLTILSLIPIGIMYGAILWAVFADLGGMAPAVMVAGVVIGIFGSGAVYVVFWPVIHVLVDQDPPGMGCLSGAATTTKGRRGASLLLMIALGAINLVGSLCVFPLIFTVPLSYAIITTAYLQMTGQPTARV